MDATPRIVYVTRSGSADEHAESSVFLRRDACGTRTSPRTSASRPPATAPARERLRLRLCVCGGECESELSLGVM